MVTKAKDSNRTDASDISCSREMYTCHSRKIVKGETPTYAPHNTYYILQQT